MTTTRHTAEQIIRKLRDAEADLAAGLDREISRKLRISEGTFHRWRNQYGGMKAEIIAPSVLSMFFRTFHQE